MLFFNLVFIFILISFSTEKPPSKSKPAQKKKIRSDSYDDESEVCQDGQPYIENHCNVCVCQQNRIVGCTTMTCTGEKYTADRNCDVGQPVYNDDCLDCKCTDAYGTICLITDDCSDDELKNILKSDDSSDSGSEYVTDSGSDSVTDSGSDSVTDSGSESVTDSSDCDDDENEPIDPYEKAWPLKRKPKQKPKRNDDYAK